MRGRRRAAVRLDWKLTAVFAGCLLVLVAAAAYMVAAVLWFPLAWIPALLGVGCLAVGLWWMEDLRKDRRAEKSKRKRGETWID